MIKEIREQKPFIHFGFNRQEITVYLNQEVDVWQDLIYKNDYTSTFEGLGISIVSVGLNKSTIKGTSLGTKTVSIVVEDKDKVLSLNSNEVLLNVVEITADSNIITADSNIITADSNIITADGSII